MATKLTDEQFMKIMTNAVVNPDGSTNKKCPICNNDVICEDEGSAHTVKCKTPGCFSVVARGI